MTTVMHLVTFNLLWSLPRILHTAVEFPAIMTNTRRALWI